MSTESEFAPLEMFGGERVHKSRICPKCKGGGGMMDKYGIMKDCQNSKCKGRGYVGGDSTTHLHLHFHKRLSKKSSLSKKKETIPKKSLKRKRKCDKKDETAIVGRNKKAKKANKATTFSTSGILFSFSFFLLFISQSHRKEYIGMM
jgi:hypothetical protein